jgi:prepilin-type N-terminal cleavage/methylation domain-containing protein
MKRISSLRSGFTLLEILLAVAALSILAGIVVFAINPGKQLGTTRDAQRAVDVNTILNALYQYSIDNGGLPGQITTSEQYICKTGVTSTACSTAGAIELNELTDAGEYLVEIPEDPTTADGTRTGYLIKVNDNGRITVSAPGAEQETISVTR